MRNAVRVASALAVGLLVGGALVTASLAWRMSRGPIQLDFLTPRLEAALAPADGSTTIDIGATALEWDPVDRDLDVRVHDLRVLGPDGRPRATVPALAVSVAPAPLLLGSVVPRAIELIAPRLHVVREPDGRFDAGIGGGPGADATRLLATTLLRRTGGEPRGGAAGVPVIRVRDAEVTLEDRASGTTWQATRLELAAIRSPGAITIERLAFDVGPGSVTATGELRGGIADLDVVVERLPARVLERWWPATAAPAMRDWVVRNVSRGSVTKARARVAASLTEAAGGPRVTFSVPAGRVAFGGLEVRWLDGMPPLTDVGGIAEFARDGWRVRVTRGELEGLDLIRALVTPAAGMQGLHIDGMIRAPLSKVLVLLERPRVRAATNFPFRPGEIYGGITAHVVMNVPLAGGRPAVRAHGELRSVSLRRAFRRRNVNARRMRFALDPSDFEMRGEVKIGRAPLALRWREKLAEPARRRRTIDIKARLDAEGRRALGVNLGDWVEGPVDLRARLEPAGQGATTMNVRVDLARAAIDLPLIGVVKDAGAPGSADARLALSSGQVSAIDDFHLRAGGSSIEGRALLAPDGTWRSAEATITMAPRSHGAVPGRAVATLRAGGTGSQLTVSADDTGPVFRAVDTYADAVGGRLKLRGEIRLRVPGMPFIGTLEADRFVVSRSPMIAKIAAMGPIPGIVDALASKGLPFSQLLVTFTQRAGVVNVAEGIAAGPGLALTLRGSVDRPRDDLSLEGTLVPNHEGLDRLLEDAPAVTALTDSGGERVRALDFSVSGSLADPYVSAKPSSSIAPSTLRELLRLTTSGRMLPSRASRRRADDQEDEASLEPPSGRSRRRGATTKKGLPTRPAARKAKPPPRRRRAPAVPSAPPDVG